MTSSSITPRPPFTPRSRPRLPTAARSHVHLEAGKPSVVTLAHHEPGGEFILVRMQTIFGDLDLKLPRRTIATAHGGHQGFHTAIHGKDHPRLRRRLG